VNQEISAAPSAPGYALRLVLIFFGAVLGLLVLSFVFGSSSASADDGDGLLSGVTDTVAEATAPVQTTVAAVTQTVQTVTHAAPAAAVTAPVAAVADAAVATVLEPTPLAEDLGTTPVGSLLEPVAKVIDDALAGTADAIGPVPGVIATVAAIPATDVIDAAAASGTTLAVAVIRGAASGTLDLGTAAGAMGDTGISSVSAASGGLLAAVAGMGFIVLLALRRQIPAFRAMPGSPVYETDSSPD
jgi:hypothetical protein